MSNLAPRDGYRSCCYNFFNWCLLGNHCLWNLSSTLLLRALLRIDLEPLHDVKVLLVHAFQRGVLLHRQILVVDRVVGSSVAIRDVIYADVNVVLGGFLGLRLLFLINRLLLLYSYRIN